MRMATIHPAARVLRVSLRVPSPCMFEMAPPKFCGHEKCSSRLKIRLKHRAVVVLPPALVDAHAAHAHAAGVARGAYREKNVGRGLSRGDKPFPRLQPSREKQAIVMVRLVGSRHDQVLCGAGSAATRLAQKCERLFKDLELSRMHLAGRSCPIADLAEICQIRYIHPNRLTIGPFRGAASGKKSIS